jgi:hypothetical protein
MVSMFHMRVASGLISLISTVLWSFLLVWNLVMAIMFWRRHVVPSVCACWKRLWKLSLTHECRSFRLPLQRRRLYEDHLRSSMVERATSRHPHLCMERQLQTMEEIPLGLPLAEKDPEIRSSKRIKVICSCTCIAWWPILKPLKAHILL